MKPLTESPQSSGFGSTSFRELLNDAIWYWEPRRIAYNLVLLAVVLGWLAFTWPHFRVAFTPQLFPLLFVLAILANVCYCAAYVADIAMQYSSFRSLWRRWRWCLWLVGVFFAASLAFFWIAVIP